MTVCTGAQSLVVVASGVGGFAPFRFPLNFSFGSWGQKIKSAPKIHATVEFDEVCMCTKFVGTASLDYL